MKRFISFFTNDLLFTSSSLIALISCLFGSFSLKSIDFKVIFCLFGLMLFVKNIEKLGILNYFAEKMIDFSSTTRSLIRNIVLLAFISSMILTNDVAILTLMPIYLTIIQKFTDMENKIAGAVLLIIAANLGSSFFPFGNPQNLFLFSYYSLSTATFFEWAFALLLSSVLFLLLSFLFIKKRPIAKQTDSIPRIDKKQTIILSLIGVFILLGVFNILPYFIVIPIATSILIIYDKEMLWQVDHKLLWTFIFFFVAVGNFSQVEIIAAFIKEQFTTNTHTFFGSILVSQIISNVPAAILIAPFTDRSQALFWGVNIGGLGTIVASLANLIGFKLFKEYYPKQSKTFLLQFTLINLAFLICFVLFFIFLL
ncbi:SLC13 family permease [Enterococcus sp. AZ126]|uniref:SLC13 family permease n=1 Tax=Enterococcus sp. AZ126 TaxID=2774635 RepID=UPI003F268A84